MVPMTRRNLGNQHGVFYLYIIRVSQLAAMTVDSRNYLGNIYVEF